MSTSNRPMPMVPKEPAVAMLENLREQLNRARVALVASGACMVDVDGVLVGGNDWPTMDSVSCAFCGDCYCSGGPGCDALDGLTLEQAAAEHERVIAPNIDASLRLRRATMDVVGALTDAWGFAASAPQRHAPSLVRSPMLNQSTIDEWKRRLDVYREAQR